MPRETELTAEMREGERERQRQRVRDLRAQQRAEPGDGLVRKAMGDALPRSSELPEPLVLFNDWRDQRLLDTLGVVISITRRQLRGEFGERFTELEPHLRKISELELEAAALKGAVDVLRGAAPPPTPRFPSVRTWTADTVYHEGDVVAFSGATYQATKDTARAPGSRDWVCLAIAGAGFTVRGTYDGNEEYKHLDVVMVNGSSFVALRDWPGSCPGDGWHLLASRGSRGNRGESGARGIMGLRGERGEAAPTIRSWEIDRMRYTATPVMSDGFRGPPLELRALFEQFLLETSDA
jgi:hypothetical protein